MPLLCKTLHAIVALAAVASAAVIDSSRLGIRVPVWNAAVARSDLPARAAKSRVYPELFTIFPALPDESRSPVDGIHLEVYKNASQVEQVATFKGIPATAQNCGLGLHVADKPNRVFIANLKGPTFTESHVTNIHQMSGLPADGKVSYKSIQGLYNETQRVGAFDFTGWDIATIGAKTISYYSVPCAEVLTFRFSLRQLQEEKSVYLQQNEANGYYIEYE